MPSPSAPAGAGPSVGVPRWFDQLGAGGCYMVRNGATSLALRELELFNARNAAARAVERSKMTRLRHLSSLSVRPRPLNGCTVSGGHRDGIFLRGHTSL